MLANLSDEPALPLTGSVPQSNRVINNRVAN